MNCPSGGQSHPVLVDGREADPTAIGFFECIVNDAPYPEFSIAHWHGVVNGQPCVHRHRWYDGAQRCWPGWPKRQPCEPEKWDAEDPFFVCSPTWPELRTWDAHHCHGVWNGRPCKHHHASWQEAAVCHPT